METKTVACEMNKSEHAFLYGVIKKMKPKKVLEIGVAGGTTLVIVECLEVLELESEMWSVDLNEFYYHDYTKRTGYEYTRLCDKIGKGVKHKFLFGKTVAGQIDRIGIGIDLVILDTMHILPGEVLDFLCIFHYLTEDAMVVLHDVNMNYKYAFSGYLDKMNN